MLTSGKLGNFFIWFIDGLLQRPEKFSTNENNKIAEEKIHTRILGSEIFAVGVVITKEHLK